jgi:hypothetical protein
MLRDPSGSGIESTRAQRPLEPELGDLVDPPAGWLGERDMSPVKHFGRTSKETEVR